MLHIDTLRAGYHGGTVLHDLTLDVPAGQVHAVAGVNGAGKTTLLHTIAGLLRPTSGRIQLNGTDITRLPTHRRTQAGIALVPQGRRIFPSLTVAEHLAIAKPRRTPPRDTTRRWDQPAVLDLFPQLAARLRHRGGQLSGGEQQMLAIARALLTQPQVLLADEPTEGLAPALAAQVRDLLAPVAAAGVAILLTTPTPTLAEAADQVTILAAGSTTLANDHNGHSDRQRLRAALTPGATTTTTQRHRPSLGTGRQPAWAALLPKPRNRQRTPAQPDRHPRSLNVKQQVQDLFGDATRRSPRCSGCGS